MRTPTWLLAVLALLSVAACSGTSPDAETRTPSPEEQALARHQARQQVACERVGTVLTDCAVAEARATLSPEEMAELDLDLDTAAPEHRAKFIAECVESDMSPRQVKVFETCLEDPRCSEFVPCLDAARPQR